MKQKKEKVPNKLSLTICPKHNFNKNNLYLNFSITRCCGPTENRTRDFCVSDKHFTAKLLAHNSKLNTSNYLNFAGLL